MGESKELLPCPFCGGEATLYSWRDCDFTTHHHIGCKCGITFEYNDVVSDLIEAWNKRVDRVSNYCETCGAKMSKSADPVKHGRWINGDCSECGFPIPTDDRIDYIAEADVHYCYHCGTKMDGETND